jgi:hypothetical protein
MYLFLANSVPIRVFFDHFSWFCQIIPDIFKPSFTKLLALTESLTVLLSINFPETQL